MAQQSRASAQTEQIETPEVESESTQTTSTGVSNTATSNALPPPPPSEPTWYESIFGEEEESGEELQVQVDDQQSSMDTDAHPDGADADPEASGDSWLAATVREYIPELADVIDKGVVGAFSGELTEQLANFQLGVSNQSVATLGQSFTTQLAGASSTLGCAAAGSSACCSSFDAWTTGISQVGADFLLSDGPLAEMSQAVTDFSSNTLGTLGGWIDGTGLQDMLGAFISSINARVTGWINAIKGWNSYLGDQVAAALGLDRSEDGLTGLIIEQAQRLMKGVFESIQAAMLKVQKAFFEISLVDGVHNMVR